MTQGTIKSIREDRGFGFIAPDGESQDVFFHVSSVEGGTFDDLREGQRVEFTAGTDPRNPGRTRAEHVHTIETTQMSEQLAAFDNSNVTE